MPSGARCGVGVSHCLESECGERKRALQRDLEAFCAPARRANGTDKKHGQTYLQENGRGKNSDNRRDRFLPPSFPPRCATPHTANPHPCKPIAFNPSQRGPPRPRTPVVDGGELLSVLLRLTGKLQTGFNPSGNRGITREHAAPVRSDRGCQ